MTNTVIIIFLIVILAVVVISYFDSHKSQTAFVTLANEQLEALKTQSGIMQLQYEICLKQAEVIQDIVVNLEDKINSQKVELDWYTANFESWKIAYEEYVGKIQKQYLQKHK